MESVQVRIARYLEQEAPDTVLLPPDQVLALALESVRRYKAYGELEAHIHVREAWELEQREGRNPPPPVYPAVAGDLQVGDSEWAVMSDLWKLYVERDQATQLEATRGLGADSFGRDSGSIAADIHAQHETLPRRAFFFPIFTI